MQIREIEIEDYPSLVALHNRVFPSDCFSPEEFRELDENHAKPPRQFLRLVALVDNQVIGSGVYQQFEGQYHPQVFYISIMVNPEHESQGIGTQLYDALWRGLNAFNPIRVQASVREDSASGRAFAEKRGFEFRTRNWQLVINPQEFDSESFIESTVRIEEHMIAIKSFPELQSMPEVRRQIWQLYSELRMDLPRTEPATPLGYENFCSEHFDSPSVVPETLLLAVNEMKNTLVGYTQLWGSSVTKDMYTGLTGVARDYRGLGIALALKVCALEKARARGCEAVYTDNNEHNVEMLNINERLGFRKEPAWLHVVKTMA